MTRAILKIHDYETKIKELDDNLTQKIHELITTVNLFRPELANKDLTIV